MPAVLVDTGVWYAMFDPRDGVASKADLRLLESRIEVLSVVIPWAIAYETLSRKRGQIHFPVSRIEMA